MRCQLYKKSGLVKTAFYSFLLSFVAMVVSSILIAIEHWIATGILFFITLVALVVFWDLFTKGDNFFSDIEQLEEKKQEKDGPTLKQNRLFKNNRYQNKPLNVETFSSSELRMLAFTYIDANDNVTFREVSVNSFDGRRISAYCLDRRAIRTFTLSNIIGKVTLRESGEELAPDEWASYWRNAA